MKLLVRVACLAAVVTAVMLASCSETVRVVVPKTQPYSATTPQSAVKAFEYAVVNRNLEVLTELFAGDFAFLGAGTDSAGNPSREVIGRREDVLRWFECLFERATSLSLDFDRNLIPFPDPRPGYVDSLFKTVRTSVDLKAVLGDGSTIEVTGYAFFYLVRGDTASIPIDLRARGFKKDKGRWWISRWEDETIASGGKPRGATDPSSRFSFGDLLRQSACAP